MILRKISLTLLCITLLLTRGMGQNPDNDIVNAIYHYNIIIVPDLSNRVNMSIHPKPIEDKEIIKSMFNLIDDILHAGHRDTHQKDCYSMSFINSGVIRMYDIDQDKLNIDFGKFNSQAKRMDFIKCRGIFTDYCLKTAKINFLKETERIYGEAIKQTDGADLWSFFKSNLSETQIKADLKPFSFAGERFQYKFRNILVLFTDGYIESGLTPNASIGAHPNQSYDLGQSKIRAFRRAFKSSGEQNINNFFKENNYGIIPANNPNLENLEVLVLELYDRSLSKSGNATVHPTDAEIMNLFWEDWMEKSNVKRFKLHKCFNNTRIAEQELRNFILNSSN